MIAVQFCNQIHLFYNPISVLTLGENEIAGNLAIDQAVTVSVSTYDYFLHTPQVDTYFQVSAGEGSVDSSKK